MDNGAKIHLSKYEMEVVTDTDWILTKLAITEKIFLFFGQMHEVYKTISINKKEFAERFNLTKNGKISKGENYLGLPYVMLDFPSFFKRDKIFAIRTMFWWGNFFSITLHISDQAMMQNKNLSDLFLFLKEKDFFVCVNEDEWQHTFESTNYINANELEQKQFYEICAKSFFKISKKIDLKRLHEVPLFLEKSYQQIIEVINISFPAGEKVL